MVFYEVEYLFCTIFSPSGQYGRCERSGRFQQISGQEASA